MASIDLTTTATVPTGTSLSVTVYEDEGDDGSGLNSVTVGSTTINYDNSASVSVAGGTTTNTLTGFQNRDGNAFYVVAEPDTTDDTLTAELDSASVEFLTPPANLTQTNAAGDSLTIEWTDASAGETDFEIYRSSSAPTTTADTLVGTVASGDSAGTGSTVSFQDTGLTEGTDYAYAVAAVDGSGKHGLSTTLTASSGPLPPTIGTVSVVNGDQLDVAWTDNSGVEDGYRVHTRPTGTATWTQDSGDLAANTASYTTTALRDGEQYDVRVEAFTTSASSFDVLSPAATTDLPDAAQPTLGNGVEDEIAVSWTDVIDYGEYDVQYRETGATTWLAGPTVDEATTSANILNLEDGEEYEVRMRTQTEHVTGAWTSPVSIITKFPGATGLTVGTVTATSVDLSWTDNSDNEDGFRVERREQFSGGWGEWRERADLAQNTTTYTDGVQPNTTYEFRIEAYTEHTAATSPSVQTTSSDDGVRTDRVPARGWYVVVEDTAGNVYTPSIVGEPTLNPRLNDLPTCEIPVERADRWDDNTQWERAPMRVYHDGVRQPIEQVEDVRQEPGRSVLVGVGGVELRQRVTTDVIERDAHLEAQDLISTNTSYLANVDDPAASTSADVLQQSVDTQSEWSDALASPPAADDIYGVTNGKLHPRQTAYFVEAEDADTQLTINKEILEQSSDRWSNGAVLEIDEASRNNQYAEVSHTFAIDHDIASADGEMACRIQIPGNGNHAFDLRVDGTTVESIPVDALVSGETVPDWFTANGQAYPDLFAADGATVTLKVTEASTASDPRIWVDCLTLYDTREPPGLTENVTSDEIEGPDLYPVVDVQTGDVVTVEQVVGGRLDAALNKTNGSQAIALSNDSGATWPVSASNSQTVEGSFSGGSTSLRARFTLGGYDSDTTTSPLGRKSPHEVDLYSLYADLEDTPLLLNRSWDSALLGVLNDIADYGNFIWEVQYDGGFSVEWTQAGQRTATVAPDLVDYQTDTDFSSIHRKAIINGTLVPASTDGVTAQHDTWVALGHDWLAETGEEVLNAGDGTAYDRGADYELRPNAGEIQALSTGTIPDGASLDVSYQRHIRGSYESADYDGTYEEFVDTIPAITTQRNANQAALALVRQASEPLVTASVTIDKQPTGMSLVEAVDVDALPVDQAMEVWSLQDSPQQVSLQLGSREQIAETIQRIQSRLAAASRKV